VRGHAAAEELIQFDVAEDGGLVRRAADLHVPAPLAEVKLPVAYVGAGADG
jgi:hypothetical protein